MNRYQPRIPTASSLGVCQFDIIKDIGEKGLLLDLFGSGEKTAKC